MWALALAVTAIAVIYLIRVNSALLSVPDELRKISPRRWTKKDLRDTYERVKKTPVDFAKILPPRLERRYVVVGGSGLVGGDIVLQLLRRGEAPESIRIVDFAPLNRRDMLETAAGCDFVKADISSRQSVDAAFSKPWPASVANKPLTVFHTAAIIRPGERSPVLYHRVSGINRDGAVNVLEAAKVAGADIFIATSSGSVGVVPPKLWTWPWQSTPEDYLQVVTEKDFYAPLRPRDRFFSNYACAKAEAERAVCAANSEDFRTGTIRPGNPIYGKKTDPVLGVLLRTGDNVSWVPHIIQNFVDSRNVALAHLQFEAALAQTDKPMPGCAGRPLNVTDPGPPIAFADAYRAAEELSVTPVSFKFVSPVVMLLLAHAIEAWCLLLAYLPFLTKLGLAEPSGPIHMLQPSVFYVSIHTVIDDSQARKSVAEGGIGYKGGCSTIEGVCEQILEWNREHEENGAVFQKQGPDGKVAKAALTAEAVTA